MRARFARNRCEIVVPDCTFHLWRRVWFLLRNIALQLDKQHCQTWQRNQSGHLLTGQGNLRFP